MKRRRLRATESSTEDGKVRSVCLQDHQFSMSQEQSGNVAWDQTIQGLECQANRCGLHLKNDWVSLKVILCRSKDTDKSIFQKDNCICNVIKKLEGN